jgi:hypothetical protein
MRKNTENCKEAEFHFVCFQCHVSEFFQDDIMAKRDMSLGYKQEILEESEVH